MYNLWLQSIIRDVNSLPATPIYYRQFQSIAHDSAVLPVTLSRTSSASAVSRASSVHVLAPVDSPAVADSESVAQQSKA